VIRRIAGVGACRLASCDDVSPSTIKTHVHRLYTKLGALR
jgi:DNA-binding CsgD family transcriptional regulator